MGAGGEVCTRSRMCYGGGEVWVHGDAAILYMSRLIQLGLRYHVMFVEIICTYILILYIYSVQYYTKYGIYSYSCDINLFNL